jgi:hypothetical protein
MLKVANSVINASRITGVLPVVNGGTGVTTSTGTGDTVLSASPTLSGDVNLSTGNLVIGTAGKGIDFSATSHLAGMTSELLADYEEGTWTPVPTGVVVNSGTPVYSGKYTKIGRTVVATWLLSGGANVNFLTSSFISLPFTSSEIAWGAYGNNGTNISIGGMATYGASLYFGTAAAGIAAAGGTIIFQV